MQWIVGHEPELHFVVIYTGYQSVVDFLQLNVESTSKFHYEGASTAMGLSGFCFKFIYHDDTIYKGWIDSRFILMDKGILVII